MPKISAMTPGTDPDGTEKIPAVQSGANVELTVAQIAADASKLTKGTIPAARLPAPTVSTLGGVESNAAVTSNWINSISIGGVPTLSQPAFSDISGTATGAQLPNPSASTLGGIQSTVGASHQWLVSISTSGVPALSQPAFTDISGSVSATQMPALTGDVTTSAGAVATTIAANAVTNAKMAAMAAWTFKVNNTSGSATPTDITIDGLTVKGTPAGGDEIIIWDVSGSALKKATVSSVSTSSGVSSIATNTGAFTLSGLLTNSTNVLQVVAAAKSDQTTAASNTLAVTPLHQQDHDSASKAWVSFTGSTGAILASYNITSVTRAGAGLFTVTFTTAFASANYACGVMSGSSSVFGAGASNQLAGSIDLRFQNLAGTNTDPAQGFATFFGRQ